MTPEEKKAAEEKAAAGKAKAKAAKMAWRITARVDGFRRGGMAHPAKPVEYPANAFTAKQIKALEAEPMLVVEKL